MRYELTKSGEAVRLGEGCRYLSSTLGVVVQATRSFLSPPISPMSHVTKATSPNSILVTAEGITTYYTSTAWMRSKREWSIQ